MVDVFLIFYILLLLLALETVANEQQQVGKDTSKQVDEREGREEAD